MGSIDQAISHSPVTSRAARRFVFACEVFAVVGGMVLFSSTALAITSDAGMPIYEEDFEGEGFPTTPELDLLPLGGMIEGGIDVTLNPAAPTLTANSVLFEIEPALGLFERVDNILASFGTRSFHLRADFANFFASPAALGETAVSLSTTSIDVSPGVLDVYALGLGFEWDGSTLTLVLVEALTNELTQQKTEIDLRIPVSSTEILSGDAFTLDLKVDRQTARISGVLEVPGAFTTAIGPLPITQLGARPLESMSVILGNLVPPAPLPATTLELTNLQAYYPYEGVFLIDSAADTLDAVVGDGSCADSLGNCTLRAAVQESNSGAGANRIVFGPLASPVVLTRTGPDEDASLTGDLDILAPLRISGHATSPSVIEGDGNDRVIHVPAIRRKYVRHPRGRDPSRRLGCEQHESSRRGHRQLGESLSRSLRRRGQHRGLRRRRFQSALDAG